MNLALVEPCPDFSRVRLFSITEGRVNSYSCCWNIRSNHSLAFPKFQLRRKISWLLLPIDLLWIQFQMRTTLLQIARTIVLKCFMQINPLNSCRPIPIGPTTWDAIIISSKLQIINGDGWVWIISIVLARYFVKSIAFLRVSPDVGFRPTIKRANIKMAQ